MANGVPGGLTECQSVLHEGRTFQFDARIGLGEGPLGGGWFRFCFASAIAWFALEVLRPLRLLREIKIRVFLFSRKDRRERKVLFTFRISRLRWSGRKLRYDKSAQRVLSTPSPLRG